MTVSALHSQIRIGVLALKEHATAATIRNIGNIRQTTVEACSSHADAPLARLKERADCKIEQGPEPQGHGSKLMGR